MSGARARIEQAWRSPAQHLAPSIGMAGYTLPALGSLEWRPIGDPADDNWLVAAPGGQTAPPPRMGFRGGSGNVAVFGGGSVIHGVIDMATSDATVIFGERSGIGSGARADVHGHGTGAVLFFGAGATVNQAAFFLQGDGMRLVVGDDCMFAHAITVRTGDDHSLVDLETGRFLNPPCAITVEPHVWICPEVHILKGSTIGFGSTIALKSIVSDVIPRFSMAGGQPARVLRSGVTWDRPTSPRAGCHRQMWDWAARIALPPALADSAGQFASPGGFALPGALHGRNRDALPRLIPVDRAATR